MKEALRKILDRGDKRILFAGVGNVLRSDDGAGVYIVSQIEPAGNISTILVEASIENYISKINALSPDVLIIADCIDFNRRPGHTGLVPIKEIKEFDISSHNISLRRVSDHLKMETYVIGVQPSDLRVGEKLTPVVQRAADSIISLIRAIITENQPKK